MEAGVDTNAPDAEGTAALHIASMHDAVDLVRLLLEAGADTGTSDYDGLTALHYASLEGASSVASMLLDASVDSSAPDMSGMTALHLACERGYWELASLLLGHSTTAKDASDQEGLFLMGIGVQGLGFRVHNPQPPSIITSST